MFLLVSPREQIEKEHNLFFEMAKKTLGSANFLGRVVETGSTAIFLIGSINICSNCQDSQVLCGSPHCPSSHTHP